MFIKNKKQTKFLLIITKSYRTFELVSRINYFTIDQYQLIT